MASNNKENSFQYPIYLGAISLNGELRPVKSLFLELPRELRDIVYHELWKHTPVIRFSSKERPNRIRYELHYNPGPRFSALSSRLPLWTLACKTILEESIWLADDMSPILPLSAARELHVNIGDLIGKRKRRVRWRYVKYDLAQFDAGVLRKLSEYFSTCGNPKVMELHLGFRYETVDNGIVKKLGFAFDLSRLHVLTGGFSEVQELEIIVGELVHSSVSREIVEDPLMKSVKELGHQIMGEGIKMKVNKTSYPKMCPHALEDHEWAFNFKRRI